METWSPYGRIGRPIEAHNVATPEAYRAYQARVIAHNRRERPALAWRDPFEADPRVVSPIVNGGRWVVVCASCGNAPLYDPEWELACCVECGATYTGVAPPPAWREIEAALMARPIMATRHWLPSESVADLLADNATHGLPTVSR